MMHSVVRYRTVFDASIIQNCQNRGFSSKVPELVYIVAYATPVVATPVGGVYPVCRIRQIKGDRSRWQRVNGLGLHQPPV